MLQAWTSQSATFLHRVVGKEEGKGIVATSEAALLLALSSVPPYPGGSDCEVEKTGGAGAGAAGAGRSYCTALVSGFQK
jgi:hypothetical protein